jgi:O-antigen ligase
MDILKIIIFCLLVIALPLGEIARISINEVAITLVDAGVALAVLLWIFINRRFRKTSLGKPIVIFALLLASSLLVNAFRLTASELLVSGLYLVRWIFYASLYFVVLDLKQIKNSIEKWMFVGGSLFVLLGFIQYFFYPDLRNLFYAGWDEHLYRMFSSFFDPNFAGAFLVLFFLFLLERLQNKNLIARFILLATFVAIILTFSRSAYLSFLAGILVYLILSKRFIHGVLITVVFIISIYFASTSVLKSEGTNLLRKASGEARLESLHNAFTIIRDYPIFGVGFNSYRYIQEDYGFIDESKMLIHSAAGTDNSFLFVLATSGVIGLASFLYLWFKIISIKNPLIISSAVALFTSSIFVNSLFFPPIMLWLWILIAIKENS